MARPLSLDEVAALVGAVPLGSTSSQFTGAATLDDASRTDVSFLEQRRYIERARKSAAGAILTREPFTPRSSVLLLVPNPRLAFAQCLRYFRESRSIVTTIQPSAVIDPEAVLGEGVTVGALAVIGRASHIGRRTSVGPGVLIGEGVEIGEECRLGSGCCVLDGVRLGRRVIVQSRTVIGSVGFGYVLNGTTYEPIPHSGSVVLEDDVEVGAGCCIDRGVAGDTFIGEGTKIDNLVQIGHNVRIGVHCLIVAQVGISGSVTIGDRCVLAGKVGVAGHLMIGSGAIVAAASRVIRDVPPGVTVAGWPAVEAGHWRRTAAILRRLPRLWERLLATQEASGATRVNSGPEHHEDPIDSSR